MNIRFSSNYLLLLCFSFFFFSCEEERVDSPILIFLTPEGTQIEGNSGDRVFITVKSSTSEGNLLSLQIESLDDEYGIVERFDSTFQSNNINYRYEYIIPAYPDSTQSILIFRLTNTQNQTAEIAKRILINKGESFVKESSGINIYSTASSRPNAFSIESTSPGFSTDSATFQADILDATAMENDTLSRSWISNTGISFVEFDGFNYADATSKSIRDAYQNGIKLSKVSQITGSNSFLVGRGNTALGAIQLISVTDQAGTEEDKYTFSIKTIEQSGD